MLNKGLNQVKVAQLGKSRAGWNPGRPWDLCTGSPWGLMVLPCLKGGAKDKVSPSWGHITCVATD